MSLLRRFALAAVLTLGLGITAQAQGTIPIALQQSVNANGQPLSGALLYLYVAGTVSVPQLAFSDVGLTQALSWPVQADQNGRLPMFYLPSGSVGVRLTDNTGQQQFYYPNMLVIGPSGGGGGGGSTTPTSAILTTGDVKFRMTSETLAGWVKLNGQTIGNASSGASGRANADTQPLFVYLWTNCPQTHCAVITGRGANALADFNANKAITLPDWRDRIPVGLDCMGNTCAGGLLASNVTSGGGDGVDTAGAFGGAANPSILRAHLPNINFGVTGIVTTAHNHAVTGGSTAGLANGTNIQNAGGGSFNAASITIGNTTVVVPTSTQGGLANVQGLAASGGSGTGFPAMNPFILGSWYVAL